MLFQKTVELELTQKNMTGYNLYDSWKRKCDNSFLTKSRATKDSSRFHFNVGCSDGNGLPQLPHFSK